MVRHERLLQVGLPGELGRGLGGHLASAAEGHVELGAADHLPDVLIRVHVVGEAHELLPVHPLLRHVRTSLALEGLTDRIELLSGVLLLQRGLLALQRLVR